MLEKQKNALQGKIELAETEMEQFDKASIKEQMTKVKRGVNEEKDRFFKKVKEEISQSKSNVMDQFNANGLPAKLKNFINSLQPLVTEQKGLCHIKLHNEGDDLHKAAVKLCQNELCSWILQEWQRISTRYEGGGLEQLLERTAKKMNFISSVKLPQSLFEIIDIPKIKQVQADSISMPDSEKKYKQQRLPAYMLSKIRTGVIWNSYGYRIFNSWDPRSL